MRYRPIFIAALPVLSLGGCASSSVGLSQNAARQTVPTLKKPEVVASRTRLFHRVLPFRIEADYESLSQRLSPRLSPDGRSIAFFGESKRKREQLFVYDFAASKTSTFDVGRSGKDSHLVARYVSWHQDSRVCAVVASSGIAVVRPANKEVRWVSREAPTSDSCVAWSPRSHQLAIFQGNFLSDNSYFRVWNGKRVVPRPDWQKAVPGRTRFETSPKQAEWSPDEKSIALRFMERSAVSGAPNDPMDLVDLDAKIGRARWLWKDLAGPVRWLDNSRLVFQDFVGLDPKSLIVARPKTKGHDEWLGSIASWTLSAQHDTFWAMTNQGHLLKTAARKQQWKLVKRSVGEVKGTGGETEIFISPKSDMVALSYPTYNPPTYNSVRWNLVLLTPANGQVWRWQGASNKSQLQIIGWAKGEEFPLVAFRPSNESSDGELWQVWQFEASK